MTALRLVDAARTDPGRVRKVNEDHYISRPEAGLWAVADGMGGHENGQWASFQVTEALKNAEFSPAFAEASLEMAEAIHTANAVIHTESIASGRSMGSTAAALLIHGQDFAVAWVGDSRIYLLRDGALLQLTRDHTQVQEMVDRGLLTPAEAESHPMSHVMSRAVGVEANLEVDAIVDQAEPGDVFLLCSDGLHGRVTDPEIAAALSGRGPETACDQLLRLCLERGAPDNVTLIAVACEQATLLTFAQPDG